MLALHLATEQMDYGAAKSLLEQGVDINTRDPDAGLVTALHIAVDIECEDSCRRCDEGDEDAAPIPTLTKLLLDYGADPTVADANGKTPRDWATQRNHSEAVKLFDAICR